MGGSTSSPVSPNGLRSCPRKFTKTLKPILTTLLLSFAEVRLQWSRPVSRDPRYYKTHYTIQLGTSAEESTTLHKDGHIASGYLDDIYLQGKNYNDCLRNIINTLKLFIKLGFIIHPTKSIFVPSKEIKMLGFILNSITMTVRLTPEKKESIKSYCIELLEKQIFTIREIAKVIGKLVASFPGVMYGPSTIDN